MLDKFLLCVGAQKAGTSWLYKQLRLSPDVEFSDNKEIHYFDHKFGKSQQLAKRQARFISILCVEGRATVERIEKEIPSDPWYRDLFSGTSKYMADFTPEYALLDQEEARVMRQVLGDAKVLFIMRNPISRSLAAVRYFYKNRGKRLQTINETKLIRTLRSDMITSRSNYLKTLQVYSSVFGGDFYPLFYEDLMARKMAGLDNIFRFLDIRAGQGMLLEETVNAGGNEEYPRAMVEAANERYYPIIDQVRRFMGCVPDSWVRLRHET